MEKQYKVFKFRIYPTDSQKELINKTIGCCRYIYNWALNMRKNAYENGEKHPSDFDLNGYLPVLKDEKEWLKEADAKALVGTIAENGTAYKNFFKGNAKHPVYRKKGSVGSYQTQLSKSNYNAINDGIIILPKMGEVKVVAHRYVDINAVKNYVTISRNTIGEYYISIKVLVDSVAEPTTVATTENTIGIDLGVKDLAILDDSTVYGKFKADKRALKHKKRLQRRLAKKVGNKKEETKSNNYRKLEKKIAKIDLTIARQRENYQYNVIKSITDRDCDYIAVEDLNVKGMEKKGGNRKKGLNNGIANAAMGEFKIRLNNKAQDKGKKVVEVDRFYPSSKTCHKCGYIYRDLKLSQRSWVCPSCGEKLGRDHNAAINIKNEGVRTLGESQKNLPKCKGDVMSVEGDTKQGKKKRMAFSTPAPVESENTKQKSIKTVEHQQVA